MAIFKETRTPYEFLVRWGKDSKIKGIHIGWLDTVTKDGDILTQTPTNVESVAIGVNKGFPLSDILDIINIDLLIEKNVLEKTIVDLNSEITFLKSKISI